MNKPYGLQTKKRRFFPLLYLTFLTLLACGISIFMTQSIARAYGYHSALGRPLCIFLQQAWYAPWQWYLWWQSITDSYGIISKALNQGQMLFVFPQIFLAGFYLLFLQKPKGRSDLHGTARWASRQEVEASGQFSDKGVYIGGFQEGRNIRHLLHNGPEHILIFAPTRSGKGVSIVTPTLLSWEESTLVLDIKGENWANTAGWRRAQGQTVLRFDPSDTTGTAAAFNPLEEIRINSPQCIPDVQNVASMIVDPDGKGLKDYWNKAAFSFLAGALLHCQLMVLSRESRAANLADLSYMLADEGRDIKELFDEMIETDHVELSVAQFGAGEGFNRQDAAVHQFIASAGREMKQKADSEMSGVLSTVLSNLALYRDPIVALNTSRCDFRIRDLMHQDTPVSLYLVLSPNDLDRLQPLIRLIVNLAMRRMTEKMEFEGGQTKATYKHKLLLLLDEFTSLGKLEIMERALAFCAGYGVKVMIIVQDLTQLQGAYGKEESIMSNCHIRAAFAPNKIETARVLSDMAGKTTVVEHKTSFSGSSMGHMKNSSISVSETARPLLTPDEVLCLPGLVKDARGKVIEGGAMLIFVAGMPCIMGKQMLFFQNPTFAPRARIVAPGCSDRIGSNQELVAPARSTMPLRTSTDIGENYENALRMHGDEH